MSDWETQAATDSETIRAWARRFPGANVGIACGPSGIVALDSDPKNGGPDSIARLEAEHGPLPRTVRQRTGSGGDHWIFKAPPGLAVTNSASKIAPGVDVRALGGLIVAAPSVTDKGPYGWINAPWEVEIADCPPWLIASLGRAPAKSGLVPDGARGYFPPASVEVLEQAREALARHGPAVDGYGGGLHTVHAAALLTHDFALTDEEALGLLLEWNETCQPPWELKGPDGLKVRLERGRKYGKRPYGCRRTLDTVAAARKMIADWQASGSDDPSPLLARVRELRWDDRAKRALISKELHAATGIARKEHDLSAVVDLAEEAAREERERAYAEDPTSDLLDPSKPLDVARRFLAHRADAEQLPEIVMWNGDYLIARGTHYEAIPTGAINRRLYEYTDRKRDVRTGAEVTPDRASVEELRHALDAAASIDDAVRSAPAWLRSTPGDPRPEDVIAFPNGLLTLEKPRRFLPPTRRFFNVNAVEFPYDPDAPPPVHLLRFFADVWPDDAESIEALQEWMGLALTPDTSHQKILLLIGPPRSGKGTINRVLQKLVGEGNYCSPTLNSLSGPFGVEPLIGKRLAVIADARLSTRSDASATAERLLSISGEDAQTIDRKHRSAWTAKLGVRFVIVANELPALLDSSGALASRFRVLQMTRSFLGREDQGLTGRLLGELPSILKWSLEGLDRLRSRGYLTQPKSAADAVEQLQTLGSPTKAFVSERCKIAPGGSVAVGDLFNAWLTWNQINNRENPGTLQIFARNLLAAFPQIKKSQPRDGDKRVRMYEGITLLPLEIDIAA